MNRPTPLLVFVLVAAVTALRAGTPVTLSVDREHPGRAIPADFSGIAYEISHVPKENGRYYFDAANKPLLQLFQTLGIKSIRIGGNTADLTAYKFPDEADVDSLFKFAQAAQVKIIYTFRLRDGDLAGTRRIAQYIVDHYGANLFCFAVGNEPDGFIKDYADYAARIRPFYAAIAAAAPGAKLCGPNTASHHDWSTQFVRDFGGERLAFIATHDYPGGAGNAVRAVPAEGIEKMLSPAWAEHYAKYYQLFAPAVIAAGVPYRIEEINNFYNGGAAHVSDTFAAALWTLDYLHWWAAHQCGGINFQNGDTVAAGRVLAPCHYAAFTTSDNGYYSHPSAYGMKAFDLGGHGKGVPVRLAGGDDPARVLNLTAYAVAAPDGTLFVTLINKEHGAGARDASVTLDLAGRPPAKAQIMRLTVPKGEVSAESGVTLGDAPITDDGNWSGTWMPMSEASAAVTVPAASAAIIKVERPPAR